MRSTDTRQEICESSNHTGLLRVLGKTSKCLRASVKVCTLAPLKSTTVWDGCSRPLEVNDSQVQMCTIVFTPPTARHQHIKCIMHLERNKHCFGNSGQLAQTVSHRCDALRMAHASEPADTPICPNYSLAKVFPGFLHWHIFLKLCPSATSITHLLMRRSKNLGRTFFSFLLLYNLFLLTVVY